MAARVNRVLQRARSVPLRVVQPQPRIVPAGASAACGTSAASQVWTDELHGRRMSERVPVAAHVSVRRIGGFPFGCRLEDVSAGGCRVELVETADIAERVIARFPSLDPFAARVAWIEARSAGFSFERTMHPAVFAHLLSRLTSGINPL